MATRKKKTGIPTRGDERFVYEIVIALPREEFTQTDVENVIKKRGLWDSTDWRIRTKLSSLQQRGLLVNIGARKWKKVADPFAPAALPKPPTERSPREILAELTDEELDAYKVLRRKGIV